MAESITLKCNAKITPYLAVGPYYPHLRMHTICGLLVPIDLFDVISICKTNDGEINLFMEIDQAIGSRDQNLYKLDPKKNLIVRAIRLLEQYLDTKFSVSIRLFKSIPTCGGLGGGSANAAATLIGINDLFNLNLRFEELLQIAIKLGSDVPFFLTPGAKWVTGKGDKLQPVTDSIDDSILLVIPPWLSRTAVAFENLKSYRESNFIEPNPELIPHSSIDKVIIKCRNDLLLFHETQVNPIEIRYKLQKQCNSKIVTLSGSGASWVVFNPKTTTIDLSYLTIKSHICNDIVSIIG